MCTHRIFAIVTGVVPPNKDGDHLPVGLKVDALQRMHVLVFDVIQVNAELWHQDATTRLYPNPWFFQFYSVLFCYIYLVFS